MDLSHSVTVQFCHIFSPGFFFLCFISLFFHFFALYSMVPFAHTFHIRPGIHSCCIHLLYYYTLMFTYFMIVVESESVAYCRCCFRLHLQNLHFKFKQNKTCWKKYLKKSESIFCTKAWLHLLRFVLCLN